MLISVDGTKSMVKFSKSKEYKVLRMVSSVIGNEIKKKTTKRNSTSGKIKKYKHLNTDAQIRGNLLL